MKSLTGCVILLLAMTGFAVAQKSITLPEDNAMAKLKSAPGVEVVRANCVACHSTDYIVRQPPADAKQWGAEVKKMMTVFGAPIGEGDAKVIVDYLASTYGPPTNLPTKAAPTGRASDRKPGRGKGEGAGKTANK